VFDASGVPHVFTHSLATGARQLDRFAPGPAGGRFELLWDAGPSFDAPWTSTSLPSTPDWVPGDPQEPTGSTHHLLYDSPGGARLIRYSAISGRLSLEALRLDASAFDFVGTRRFTPGGLSLLGDGPSILATGTVTAGGSSPGPAPVTRLLAWHHAPSAELRVHAMQTLVPV
jgi:hypothetical protein